MLNMGNNNKRATSTYSILSNTTERFQIVLLGDLTHYKPPTGTTSFFKRFAVQDKTIDLLIWEPVNHNRFPRVWPEYVRKSDGVLLLYEVSDMKTSKSLSKLLRLIKKYNSNAVTFLVGNKSDFGDCMELPYDAVEDLAKRENLEFFQCSAKNRENVNKVFEHLVFRILQIKKLLTKNENEESPIKLDNIPPEGKSSQTELKSRNTKDKSQLISSEKESFIEVGKKSSKNFHSHDVAHSPPSEVIHEEIELLEGKCTTWYIDQKKKKKKNVYHK